MEFEKLSWAKYDSCCKKIARWAKKQGFEKVYGIPRGGLFISARVSHLLNVPLLTHEDEVDEKTLVVDDIADSGRTLSQIKQSVHIKRSIHIKTATIYYHRQSAFVPDFWLLEKTEKWVLFPWETPLTTSKSNNGKPTYSTQ